MASRKPREWWIVVSETSGMSEAYWGKRDAKARRDDEQDIGFNDDHEVVHVREVIPAPPKKRSKRAKPSK